MLVNGKDPRTELVLLDPKRVRLENDRPGWLRLYLPDFPEPLRVRPVRNYPITDPDHYLSLLTEQDEEVGVIVDPQELDPDSFSVLQQLLERIYFLPTITKIIDIVEDFGILRWEVETTKGPRTFEVSGRDNVRFVGQGHILIRDIDGNRYHIYRLNQLDHRSRILLERVL